MIVSLFLVCCLLATSVTCNEDEREIFDFDLEMSFEVEEINGPVDTFDAVTVRSGALRSPTAESEPVPEAFPEPAPKMTTANQSASAKLDMKRKTPYSFEYAVEDSKSGLDYGHKESSDGEVVTGTYYVLLPDGRKETVKYKADGNGYVADVSYEGETKNGNAQSQKAASTFGSSGTSAQMQAYSNSSSPVNTSSMSSIPTKGPSFPPSSPVGAPSADRASLVSTASAVSSTSSLVSATATTTKPSSSSSSTLILIPSPILTPTTQTTTPTPEITTSTTGITTPINGTATPPTTPTKGATSITLSISGTTISTTTPTSATTVPINAITRPTATTAATTESTTVINGTTTPTTPTNITSSKTTTPIYGTTTLTANINITSSSSIPAVIASTVTLPSTTTPLSVAKSTLNSTLSPVSFTISASLSKSSQNSTSVSLPQQVPQTTNNQVTSTPASSSTRPPDGSTLILNIVPEAPGTSSSKNQSFFQALAGFIRSAGPTFIYCRNLLPSCSDSTRSPAQAYFCGNCNNLKKICSKSRFIGEMSPFYNDTLQAFQTLVPTTPVWPANKSPVAELEKKVVGSTSSENPPNSNSTLPPTTPFPASTPVPQSSSVPKTVSLEVPEGLDDIVQSADTHFSYCQKVRSFCPRLESTRPYWEGSSETPFKQKEFLLSTIQACSYCRSLWPICSELESSEFLLDPSQLFTLAGLEEDVRNAVFTVSYCRNSTQDCNQLLKSNQSTTMSPIPSLASKSSTVTVDKLIPVSSMPSQNPEPQREKLGDIKFSNYCSRMTPICSQLLSV